MGNTCTAEEVWIDFYENVYPGIKAGLTKKESNRIITANRDFLGKRTIKGKRANLGPARIADIVQTYAPGRYHIEMVWVFRRVE